MIFGAFGLMGKFGKAVFAFNFQLFGIFSYVYPLLLLYLGYLCYKNKALSARLIEVSLAWIFLFLILLVLQASSLDFGAFGKSVVSFLQPHLGSFGIWILCLFWIFVCFLSLSEKNIIDLYNRKVDLHKALFNSIGMLTQMRQSKLLGKISQKCKNAFSTHPLITQSPSIELPSPSGELTEESLTNLPLHKESTMPKFSDEPILIQEVFIKPEKKTRKPNIRILDEYVPPKENPFLQNDFSHEALNISTSAELLKKIKNQNFPARNNPPSPAPANIPSPPIEEMINPTQKIPHEQTSPIFDLHNAQPKPLNSNNLPDLPTHQKIQEEQKDRESSFVPLNEIRQITPTSSKRKITHIKSLEENEALLKEIDQGEITPPKNYTLPPISLLSPAPKYENEVDENEIDSKIQSLLAKLSVFKIEGDVIRTYSGPIITTFEFRPAPNVKVSRIQSLESDIAMALEAKSIRIQAPIPGKNVVGIEIPNSSTQTIYLREIFESEIFQNSTSPLTLALGKDVVGNPFITDLKKLPHLLIAGTTGSGKSVGVNAMILSLLYRNSPDDLKLMMVDPKMVEFMPYSDLPHLITPIITDPKKAIIALSNAVAEMERRYALMSQSRTKEIVSYNQKAEELGAEKFPYFVIIIDELADLMMTAGKEVEYSMARIAQMGRASGMHLIVATQSPRAEVLTGLIKTNLPAHLSYKVGTKIDSAIIGCPGAESLLGRGDMLFTPPGMSGLVRLHAPWSSEEEINEIIAYIKAQREVAYDTSFLPEEKEVFGAMDYEKLDEETTLLLSQAKQIILSDGKTSISYLQRRLSIGYNKAADLIEKLEQSGFLSEADARGNRRIL